MDCTSQGFIGNMCVDVLCNSALGCVNVSKLEMNPEMCNDDNECTVDFCDPTRGCVHSMTQCNDNNPCTTDLCDVCRGCIFVPVACNVSLGASCGISYCQDGITGTGICDFRAIACPQLALSVNAATVVGTAGIVSIIVASILCLGGVAGCAVYATQSSATKSANPLFLVGPTGRNPMYDKT